MVMVLVAADAVTALSANISANIVTMPICLLHILYLPLLFNARTYRTQQSCAGADVDSTDVLYSSETRLTA